MSTDVKPLGVGVIGSGPFAWHACERLSWRDDFAAVACWPPGVSGPSPPVFDGEHPLRSFSAIVKDRRVDVLYFVEPLDTQQVCLAIESGKPCILQSAASLDAGTLRSLAELATARGSLAIINEPRRWDDDFLNAKTMSDEGQFGRLQRVRLAIHEQTLPGAVFPRGVLREFGYCWIDQLLAFVDDSPRSVHLRRFGDSMNSSDHGFLAIVDFTDGVSAVVEVQLRSLLSLRTGWLLEGTEGAYRTGRRYTVTADGEIIDEPVSQTPASSDPFWETFAAAINGDSAALSSLPNLSHAGRVASLIEKLETCVG